MVGKLLRWGTRIFSIFSGNWSIARVVDGNMKRLLHDFFGFACNGSYIAPIAYRLGEKVVHPMAKVCVQLDSEICSEKAVENGKMVLQRNMRFLTLLMEMTALDKSLIKMN